MARRRKKFGGKKRKIFGVKKKKIFDVKKKKNLRWQDEKIFGTQKNIQNSKLTNKHVYFPKNTCAKKKDANKKRVARCGGCARSLPGCAVL